MPDSDKPTCGKWMPRKRAYSARRPLHKGDCRTAEAMADTRERLTDRRRGVRRRDDPEAKKRWNRAYKFTRLGISEERFIATLEAQDYACGMCHVPFGDEFPHADHDHNLGCHPFQPKARARACEKCFRGLLCFRCNTALGYVEKYGDLAKAYLDQVTML